MSKPKQKDKHPEFTELLTATENENLADIQKILEGLEAVQKLELLCKKNEYHDTVLHIAASRGLLDVARLYLEELNIENRVTVLNTVCACGSTPLQRAANNGYVELVVYFLSLLSSEEVQQQLLAQNSSKDSALHRAAWNGHLSTVSKLINSLALEARTNMLCIQNADGDTALHDMATNNHSQCMHVAFSSVELSTWLLVLTKHNCDGLTAFHLAIENSAMDAVKVILQSFVSAAVLLTFVILHKLPKQNQSINERTRECLATMWPDDGRLTSLIERYYEKDTSSTVKPLLDELTDLLDDLACDKDILTLCNHRGETILHVASKANHLPLVTKLIHVSEDKSLNATLVRRTNDRQCPFSMTACKHIKNLLAWSEAQEGFYYLKIPPKVIIAYLTDDRPGAEKEKTCISSAFPKLSLQPVLLKDPTEMELMDAIRQTQETETSGLILAIMCHGDRGSIYVKDQLVAIKDVLQQMNSPTLAGKPKVLLLQACQTKTGEPTSGSSADPAPPLSQPRQPPPHYDLPGHDFAVIAATINEGTAQRNLMIPVLATLLQNSLAGDDLHDIFLQTKARMMETNPEQVPEYRTTLSRKLCLRRIFHTHAKYKTVRKRDSKIRRFFSRSTSR